MQHMVDHNGTAGALPAQVPGLWQLQRSRFGEQPLQRVLVFSEIADARPLSAGQTVPRQIAGDHGKPLVQRPGDDMPIESGVIIKTMEHEQCRLGSLRPPELTDQLIAIDLESP
ncbi:hypothetical protein D3C73_948930 [compost metagenome]